jgi:hypothetical protein
MAVLSKRNIIITCFNIFSAVFILCFIGLLAYLSKDLPQTFNQMLLNPNVLIPIITILFSVFSVFFIRKFFLQNTRAEIFFFLIFLLTLNFDGIRSIIYILEQLDKPEAYVLLLTRVAYFGKKEYARSQKYFESMLDDWGLDAEKRNSCYLYLAYIENDLYNKEAADRELELADKYIAECKTERAKAPGYAIKGIALYYKHENDSAFVYLEKAHRLSDDLNTKILAITGLEWVATQMRQYQAAWNAEITNKEYQEQLNRLSNQSEITQIQLQHNDEMQNLKFRTRVTRVIWISISLIIILIAAVIIYIIQRDRKREAYYLKKYDDLIQKQIEEKANSEGNRIMEACEAFRTGIAFNLVNDVALQKRSFRQEERDVVVHDINLYFANPIAALRAEAGRLGQQDINLIFCTLLGFDQELVADIMCTSRSNMRSIKSRLKSKISADTFSLYFKE